mgnify:CR=1 FL=1
MGMKKLGRYRLFVLTTFALAFVSLFYMALVEPFRLVVTSWTVATPKWAYDRDLRIVLISDPHAIYPWMSNAHLERVVEAANDLQPDIILLLGDYVATHPFGFQLSPEDGVVPYKKLRAECGVYAVLGNHDLHESVGWPDALERTGIPVLRNQSVRVGCYGLHFWVAGLDELWWGDADLQKTMSDISDRNPVILMMHNPDSFSQTPADVALTVAGHTHGGQISLPIIGPLSFVIPSRYGLRYVYGHIQEDEKDLVVSGGVGSTGLPLRLLRPPELVVITLKKEFSPAH